jgi:aryl-alcohol dehydrogenase-like predicted oxidoreductase
MEKRTLGGADLSVTRIALGTMTFGAQVDEATAAPMIDDGLDRGINFIDTANVYNAGLAEQMDPPASSVPLALTTCPAPHNIQPRG